MSNNGNFFTYLLCFIHFWRIFATLYISIRIVAQLVAHYVRDVGVGRSSRLYPTQGDKRVFSFVAFSFSFFVIS